MFTQGLKQWITKKRIVAALIFCSVVFCLYFDYNYSAFFFTAQRDPLTVIDNARLYPKRVHGIFTPVTEDELRALLKEAREEGRKVTIRGSGHSQGGHIVSEGATQIDMRSYNKILDIDTETRQATIQAGATWDGVQRALNPFGLAVETMQSSNIFTVGGTLSANAHGRDLTRTTFIESVISFRLMDYKGDIHTVSREENAELFSAVIGGYGLLGIILDVTIEVIPNVVLKQETFVTNPSNLLADLQKKVLDNPHAEMFLARPSFVKGKLFDEIIGVIWSSDPDAPTPDTTLSEEKNIIRDKFIFSLSRWSDWAKVVRWKLQKDVEMGMSDARYLTRNNAMRPPLGPLLFLEYESPSRTDVLQEYYVPLRNAEAFIAELKIILETNDVNVISTTIRYVRKNNESILAYAPKEDMIAVIFMTNVSLKQQAQDEMSGVVQSIVDKVIEYGGSYYLTYQLYPTREHVRMAYSRFDEFIATKLQFDPEELFSNNFYETYK